MRYFLVSHQFELRTQDDPHPEWREWRTETTLPCVELSDAEARDYREVVERYQAWQRRLDEVISEHEDRENVAFAAWRATQPQNPTWPGRSGMEAMTASTNRVVFDFSAFTSFNWR